MLKTRLINATLAACSMAFALPSMAQSIKWDMPTAYPATNFHTVNISQFAKDVDQATGGKLKITVHSNASLFKANEIKRAVQGGQAQVGEIILSGYQNEWQVFGADGLPFVADSYEEAERLYKAQKPVLDRKLAEQGLKLLFSVPWPPQGLYSSKPVNSAADLKGSKWRAYSPATSRIAELVGAQPVTVQAAELAQALATGAVETNMTSAVTGVDSKFFDAGVKFYYDMQAWLPKNAVLVNQAAFSALDKAAQEAVVKAAAAAEARGWQESKKVNESAKATLQKNKISIEAPSTQLKADMQRVGSSMLLEWLSKAGADGKEIIDAFNKK
ncbi:TRAP transporter substrate-binding protein [Hydrogenophaga sp.]|jgi:TRAP-type C4-dicarboxylate transport system substrate-binding protein|uniref:TRAP transporter substrate-binding protein n=1 Tax=Hydrogenophaga sp. TaxID=1904254 RepID=UPI003918E9FF